MRYFNLSRSVMPPPWPSAAGRAIAVVVIFGFSAASQDTKRPPVLDVQNLMTVSEFRRAGLQKLSAEELEALNAWLGKFALAVSSSASPASSSATPESPATLIESQMDGEFEGWTGDTIFKLANGQIWQQSSYAYTYHYAYRPKVLIYRTGIVYQMRVDGVEDSIQVKRLK